MGILPRANGARQTGKLSVTRDTSGRLYSVNVPIVTESDPAWFQAAATIAGFGPENTYSVRARHMLTMGKAQEKLAKSDKHSKRYRSAALHLAPHYMSGRNVCAMAHGCAAVCVGFNGKGVLANDAFEGENNAWRTNLVSHALQHAVHAARIAKTRLLAMAPELFAEALELSIGRFVRACVKDGKRPLIRPNATSDIPWETWRPDRWVGFDLFERFPSVQWYDYTKLFMRASAFARGHMPRNYDITFSRDETNGHKVNKLLELGGRVAVVVRSAPMITSWGAPLAELGRAATRHAITHGIPGIDDRFPRVDGDKHDMRHTEPKPGVVVLYAKGRAARDNSGFAVDLN